jgi:hypothetical protein
MKIYDLENISVFNQEVNGKIVKPGNIVTKVPEDKLDMSRVTNKFLKIIGEANLPEEEPRREVKKEAKIDINKSKVM